MTLEALTGVNVKSAQEERGPGIQTCARLYLCILYLHHLRFVHGLSSDGIALLAFKRSITTDPFQVLSNWNEQDTDPCSWCGVTCNAESMRVTVLNISGLAFSKPPPAVTDCDWGSTSFFSSLSNCQMKGAAREAMSNCCTSANALPLGSTNFCPYVVTPPICLQNGSIVDPSSGYQGPMQVPCLLSGPLPREIGNLSELAILSLPFNGFSGEIPKEIGNLKRLKMLDLEANKFTGPIPSELGQLSQLCVLNLAQNELQGYVPLELSSCLNLCYLSLSVNTLQGGIPPSLGGLGALQWLALSSNLLDSEIPIELAQNCWTLQHLDLANNFLTGPIPHQLANCRRLQSLLLTSNNLVGRIPPDLGQLSKLQTLHLALNNLTGAIPPELSTCTQLSTLLLTIPQGCPFGANCTGMFDFSYLHSHMPERNQFSGLFPPELAVLPSIQHIWAPGAGLSGGLPSDWGNCPFLENLNLAQNSFTGEIPAGLGSCGNLLLLDLSSNHLNGSIPPQLPISCLEYLNVSSNTLSGNVWAVMDARCNNTWVLNSNRGMSLSPLRCFDVATLESARLYHGSWKWPGGVSVVHDFSSNYLTGEVPGPLVGNTLVQKQAGYLLLLSNNQFTGRVPAGLFSLCQYFQGFAVSLSHNLLSAELPLEVSTCNSLWYFDASENQLSGSIPGAFAAQSNLTFLNLAYNQLEGDVPQQIGQLEHLQGLILTNNQLNGSIPAILGNLSALVVLDLSRNGLEGNIPKELGKLRELQSLLLNNNTLSGSIPAELSNLTSLEQLDLSFNNLSGQFPVLGNWGGLCSRLVVMGNPYLQPCGVATAPRPLPILADPNPHQSPDQNPYQNQNQNSPGNAPEEAHHDPQMLGPPSPHLSSIVVAAITFGCAIGVVLLVLGLLFQCTKEPRSPTVRAGRKEVVTFNTINFQLTYDKVVQSTGNFSLDNLIGTGGFGATYKAELRPGLVVAVKRLAIGRFQGVQQFDAEIRTLGRIRHSNLVTLIGYHASEEEMFLIYNFFPQGNLETLIHASERGRRMDWRRRHKIALDIARALAYLHDECVPRVLHRDIKPSNILLDNNLDAHLSDFGLARLLGDSETHATTDVAGTLGYLAPEYAMTRRVSDKADVYSYGVVLLELLSGKRALDASYSNYGDGFNIVTWATLLINHKRPHEVFAVGLWEMGPESDLLEVLNLAILCTKESQSVRPTMRQVVERLRLCQPSPLLSFYLVTP